MTLYYVFRSDGLTIRYVSYCKSLSLAKKIMKLDISYYNKLRENDDSNSFKMYSMNGMEYVQIDDEEDESCCWRIIPIKVDMSGEAI